MLAVRLSRINNKPEMGMAGAALGSGPHAGTRLCRSDYALGMMWEDRKRKRRDVGADQIEKGEMKRNRRI